jgi:hypothetical protein
VSEKPPVTNYEEPPPPVAVREEGNVFADVIGFAPNLRKADNLFQAKFIGGTVGVFVIAGCVYAVVDGEMPLWAGATIGVVGGLVIGVLVSGTILAIRRLKR